jgi:hypothetical protein
MKLSKAEARLAAIHGYGANADPPRAIHDGIYFPRSPDFARLRSSRARTIGSINRSISSHTGEYAFVDRDENLLGRGQPAGQALCVGVA